MIRYSDSVESSISSEILENEYIRVTHFGYVDRAWRDDKLVVRKWGFASVNNGVLVSNLISE